MKKTVCLLLLLAALATHVGAATAVPETRLTEPELAALLGQENEVKLTHVRVCEETANLLFLARDRKSRALRWFLVNPRLRSVLSQGVCPFREYYGFQIAPDQSTAVFHGRHPHGFFALNLKSGDWTPLFRNGDQQLFSLSVSPLAYLSADRVMSLLDEHDAEGYVTDSFLVQFDLARPAMVRWASMARLQAAARKLLPDLPPGTELLNGEMTFAGTEGLAATLRVRSPDGRLSDALCSFDWAPGAEQPTRAELLDRFDGRILPLDCREPSTVLYRRHLGSTTQLMMAEAGEKRLVLEREVMLANFLGKGEIGVVTVRAGGGMQLLMGPAAGLEEVWGSTRPYAVGFVEGGSGIVLINDSEVRLLRVPR
ncbi:MAG: hypothetical protein HY319_23370 [Armatimonadetes bacterium]|nr:hypothetical protein [Armatimonadota bacterium]